MAGAKLLAELQWLEKHADPNGGRVVGGGLCLVGGRLRPELQWLEKHADPAGGRVWGSCGFGARRLGPGLQLWLEKHANPNGGWCLGGCAFGVGRWGCLGCSCGWRSTPTPTVWGVWGRCAFDVGRWGRLGCSCGWMHTPPCAGGRGTPRCVGLLPSSSSSLRPARQDWPIPRARARRRPLPAGRPAVAGGRRGGALAAAVPHPDALAQRGPAGQAATPQGLC